MGFLAYYYNSALITDVDDNGELTAADALSILRYVVGKDTGFVRDDTEGKGDLFYVPWVDEWEPGMVYQLGEYHYKNLAWPSFE